MTKEASNRHEPPLRRYALLFLGASTIWFLATLRFGETSFLFVLACIAVGLLYAAAALIAGPNRAWLWDLVCMFILLGGNYLVMNVLFPKRTGSDWLRFSQQMSIVIICVSAVYWAFRRKRTAVS